MGRILKTLLLLIRLAFEILGWVVMLSVQLIWTLLVALASFWTSVPRTADTLANHWLDRATRGGFPTRWSPQLYHIFYTVAVVLVVVGFVLTSLLVSRVVEWFFGSPAGLWTVGIFTSIVMILVLAYSGYWFLKLVLRS